MEPLKRWYGGFSKAMILALLLVLAGVPGTAAAKIYKYKDDQGKTHFTDDAGSIPKKYRNQIEEKKYRGVGEATPSASPPGGMGAPPGPGAADASSGAPAGKRGDDGLSEKDLALIDKAIPVLKAGVALAEKYENVQPNFASVRGLIDGIQSALPAKKALAKDLAGSKAPVLKSVLSFLQKSIGIDEQTKGAGTGLKTQIVGIIKRVADEGKEQAKLIQDLEKAKKEDKQKKKDAKSKAGAPGAKTAPGAPGAPGAPSGGPAGAPGPMK